MRSLTEALLYPGVGWLEATNLATGRGTDTPFERVGAPWVDSKVLAEALNSLGSPSVRFVPISFVPRERQYQGQTCGGVQILITDWKSFDPLSLGLDLALALRRLYPVEWNPEGILKLLGDRDSYQAILEGKAAESIERLWKVELESFKHVRSRYLIYD
jgi:uncharacterized protein YbbC (DUF1343 family)